MYEFSLGYGYVFNLLKYLSIKPNLFIGYSYSHFVVGKKYYEWGSSNNILVNTQEDNALHGVFINPSIDFLIAYHLPFSLMVSVGYSHNFINAKDSWNYRSANTSYETSYSGLTLNGGLMIFF
ncbi:MAG: hypothetical protein GY754_03615 [bacterium]|nr:hypothetical protein [bacterium]